MNMNMMNNQVLSKGGRHPQKYHHQINHHRHHQHTSDDHGGDSGGRGVLGRVE